jgi:hypothetical protein
MAEDHSPVAAELKEARDLCVLADPEQLALIQDETPGRDAGTAVAVAERRGRGRPPGSINRRSAKFREQLLGMCGGMHPAMALARASTTPLELLAAQLQCSKLEAAQFAQRAAIELLPYMESKQPVDVNLSRRNDVVLIMAGGGVGDEEIEDIRRDLDDAGEIDWEQAEIIDVLPSLSGEPSRDVSPEGGG